ncbi:MAG: anthranilate synthase component I family protein, partial [Chitinophagaceae bacterium]
MKPNKRIVTTTNYKKILSDVHTPVGIYLRLRDRFRDTILLESTDYHVAENSYSFICINAIAGIEITGQNLVETKFPGQDPFKKKLEKGTTVPTLIWEFMQQFDVALSADKPVRAAQGLFGYTSFDAVRYFDTLEFKNEAGLNTIPLMRYRLYQYVIVINHFKDELYICENTINGIESELKVVESLIRSRDVPVYPFNIKNSETSNLDDEQYREMVRQGIQSCLRGDVFQIVLSRRFQQSFTGDEFNVYRALRNINPSPYLFFFDYGDYK